MGWGWGCRDRPWDECIRGGGKVKQDFFSATVVVPKARLYESIRQFRKVRKRRGGVVSVAGMVGVYNIRVGGAGWAEGWG